MLNRATKSKLAQAILPGNANSRSNSRPGNFTSIAAPAEGRRILGAHMSVPIAEDITVTNKTSQNLHAELLLRLLGKLYGTDGSFEEGARVVRQFMVNAGVDDGDFFLVDGCGLSNNDKMTPRAFTRLLAYASKQPWGEEWRETLPVAGVDGTLDHRFTNSPLKGQIVGQDGHAERGEHALRLPECCERSHGRILDSGQWPLSWQQR